MKPGMVFTIEPMINTGKYDVKMFSIEYENEENRAKIDWIMSRNNYERVDFDQQSRK